MELGFTLSLILVVDSGLKQPVYIASLVLLAARMEEPKNGTETGIAYAVEGRPRLFETKGGEEQDLGRSGRRLPRVGREEGLRRGGNKNLSSLTIFHELSIRREWGKGGTGVHLLSQGTDSTKPR